MRVLWVVLGGVAATGVSLAVRAGALEGVPLVKQAVPIVIVILGIAMLALALRLPALPPGKQRTFSVRYADVLAFCSFLPMAITGMHPGVVAAFALVWLAIAVYQSRHAHAAYRT